MNYRIISMVIVALVFIHLSATRSARNRALGLASNVVFIERLAQAQARGLSLADAVASLAE